VSRKWCCRLFPGRSSTLFIIRPASESQYPVSRIGICEEDIIGRTREDLQSGLAGTITLRWDLQDIWVREADYGDGLGRRRGGSGSD
jgi:hypothetical protein